MLHYDFQHQSLILELNNNSVFVKLSQKNILRYKILSLKNLKMKLQQVESFKILAYVDNLTYYLNILTEWLIHNVISVTQLEPALQQADSYMRLQNNHSEFIEYELNDENYKYYKIESLFDYYLYQYNCREF